MREPCKHRLVRRVTPHCLNCGASLPDPKDEKILKAIVAAVMTAREDGDLRSALEEDPEVVLAAHILAAARKELES